MKTIKFLILTTIGLWFYYGIDWENKILVAVYMPQENKRCVTDDLIIRSNATKNLYFGIPETSENCKLYVVAKKDIKIIIYQAEKNYPKSIEIRIKKMSNIFKTIRYIKDKNNDWISL